MKQKKKDFEK